MVVHGDDYGDLAKKHGGIMKIWLKWSDISGYITNIETVFGGRTSVTTSYFGVKRVQGLTDPTPNDSCSQKMSKQAM